MLSIWSLLRQKFSWRSHFKITTVDNEHISYSPWNYTHMHTGTITDAHISKNLAVQTWLLVSFLLPLPLQLQQNTRILCVWNFKLDKDPFLKTNSLAGNWTPVSCVTNRDTHHYTTKEAHVNASFDTVHETVSNCIAL